MNTNGILIHPEDQVVTVTLTVKAGENICYAREGHICLLEAKEEIPQYHKVSITDIKKGQRVCKYGQEIGEATADIAAGAWVHTHNLQSTCMVCEKDSSVG